jgi:ankyrin repeat protein/Ran GTPase-activating protein (RanGAP) involved in mRNA processing and transport
MFAKILESDKQLFQRGLYTAHCFKNLLSSVKTDKDATHEPAEDIGDLLIFTQNLEAIEEYNNPENVYTRMEGALAKWIIAPDSNVMRYYITVGKYYQKKERYDEAMRYYSRARWVGEIGNNVPGQQETLQILNTELQLQFDDLEAILTYDYLIPWIRNCREKLTSSLAIASVPTAPLSCESLSKLFELINPFADRLMQLRQEDRCKKLYDDSYLMSDFDACLKQAQAKLEILRQQEGSECEFYTLVQLLAAIAAQLKRHRQYEKAIECYNLLCQEIEEKKEIDFPFAFDVAPFHRECDVIKAELLKKTDPLPFQEQFSWQRYRQELCELRELFNKNKEETNTSKMQHSFTEGCKGLIKNLWEDCVSLLSQPPCPFCIMGLGAISRNELAPYSDLDFALLIECQDYKGHEYLQYLVKLFALKVTLIGELDPSGFTIDSNKYTSFLLPAQDRNLIDTPSGYLKRFLPGAGEKGTESDASSQAYALHRPVLLYATPSGERLFEEYRQKLQETWQEQISTASTSEKSGSESGAETSCVYQQEAEMWQAVHNYQYMEQIKFDSESTLHLKERYLAPLTFWISDMALKHGIFELDTFQQLELLKSKLADNGFIDKIKEALNTLHCLRVKIQQVCHRQQDIVYKPESIIKPIFIGLHFESLLRLTEEEYLRLQDIDKTVLQPAFAMTGVDEAQIECSKKSINSNNRLFQAIKHGQTMEIDFLITSLEAIDLNFRDSSGKAALHLALDHDEMLSIKIVEKLIGCSNADVNIKTTETKDKDKVEGQTPLHIAAHRGFKSIVQLLLEHQADAQLKDSKGRTPLHYAAKEDKYEVVEVLLNKCIEITKQNLIDTKDKSGSTPLHYSLVNKDRGGKIARLLLKNGADENAVNDQKLAPIHVAAKFNKPEIIEQLLKNNPDIKVDARDEKGRTPLHWAVKPNHESVVKQLLDAGADVNIAAQERNWTPLHYAVADGASIQIVQWLLEKGSNPTIEDKQGQSPLALAKAKCLVDLMLEWEKIRNILQKNSTLTELDLSNRHIGVDGLQVLTASLRTDTILTKLNLAGNHLGAESASLLAEALTTNITLTQLHLADNDLGSLGLQALDKALTNNQTLTQLNLAQNALGAAGAKIIASMLVGNTALTELDLSANQLTLDLLVTALRDNYTLKALHLQNNGLSDAGTEHLARALTHHLSLTHLNLRGNGIGEAGAMALAQLLSQDTCRLKRLNLSANPLGLTGIAALAKALQDNTNLMTFELSGGKLSVASLKILAESLQHNTSLMTLIILEESKDPAALTLIEELRGYLGRNLRLRHQAIQSHWEQGQQCTTQRRYLEAIVHYHHVLSLDPEYQPAINASRQAQADFYHVSPSLTTELLLAATQGQLKRVQALVQQGAALSSQDKLGHTVLWWAAANGKGVVTRWLLTQGAPLLGASSQLNETVAHTLALALKTTQTSTSALIKACQAAQQQQEKNQAAQQQQEQDLRILTRQDSPLCQTTGYTALHIAAWAGQTELVRRLLQRDKSVSATLHETQQTPLHLAIQADHVDTANALIQYGGAPLNVADKAGQTPLDLITQSPHNLHNRWIETTKYLVYAYQQEQHLQQLRQKQMAERLVQAQTIRQQQAITFAEEAEALRQALLTKLSKEDDGFGVLRQAAWRAFRHMESILPAQLVEMCQQQLEQLEPSVILLKFKGHSLAEKAKFFVAGSLGKHPVFTRLRKRRKVLQALNQTLTAAGASALAAVLDNIIAYDQDFIQQACQSAPDKRKQLSERFMVLYAAGLPPRLLQSEAQSLFAQMALQSREASESASGTSLVRSFQGMHFKRKPYAPGVEFMVSTLGRLLVGRGITPSELIKVLDTGGFPLPYLASKTVIGVELGHIIREHPDYLDYLRADNFSKIFLLSLLIDPQDGKPDNYMAEMHTNEAGQLTSVEIIGIDNDIAFGEPYVYHHTAGNYKGKPFVTVKNVLYFFPQMATPLDAALRRSLLELEPAALLLTWLQALQDKNQHYQQLWEEGVFTTEELRGGKTRGMQLPIRLRPGTVTRLYQKLRTLQAYLSEHPEATHQVLFQRLEPDLFQHYQAIQARYPNDIMHCLRQLYLEAQPTVQARLHIASQLRSQQTAALTHSVLESTELKMLEAQQTLPIEKAVAELLTLLDYERFNADSLALLDEQLQRIKFEGVSNSCDPLELYRYMLKQQYCSETFLKHLLTQRGLLPQSTYPGGDTPLHLAVQHGHQAIAVILLEYGADVNHVNDAGYSPLHVAASRNDLPMVKLLLQAGADKEKVQTKTGHTPLDKALSKGHEAVAQWLLEQGATSYLPIYQDKVAALHKLPTVPVADLLPPSSSTMPTATLLTRYSLLRQDSRQFLLSGNTDSNSQMLQSDSP